MRDKKLATVFLFLLSPFISLPFILIDIFNKRKGSLFLFSCFIGILAYLYLPSISQDGARRYLLYETFKAYSIYDFIYSYLIHRSDVIYYFLIYIFATLGLKFQFLLFALAFFNVYIPLFIFSRVIKNTNISSNKYFSFFFLIVLSFSLTFLFSGVRNNVAFNLVFLGFYYLFFENKKRLPYLLLVLGVLTHFSMVFFLPIFLFANRLNLKLLIFGFIILAIISFVLPSDIVQSYFQSMEVESKVYNSKIQGYSSVDIGNEKTTIGTFISKILFTLWFYFSLIYVFLNIKKNRDKKYLTAYLLFALPVLFFIAFPTIFNRYLFGLKFFLILLLIKDSFYWNNKSWRIIFIMLLIIQPLYDITRLLTQSFIKGYFRFENIGLIQIIMQTYEYKDMLPIY